MWRVAVSSGGHRIVLCRVSMLLLFLRGFSEVDELLLLEDSSELLAEELEVDCGLLIRGLLELAGLGVEG